MKVKINGKEIQTETTSLLQLQAEHCAAQGQPAVLVNGFQCSEDGSVSEGDEILFLERGKLPDRDGYEAMMSARYTPRAYRKFKNARVAVAGLGGLGSNIAVSLARTGVGHLHLIDFDVVEPSNLNRQQYRIAHLGMPKADALKMELEEINPFIKVQTDRVKVTPNNIKQLFEGDEIICEAFDRPEAKALLVNHLLIDFPEKKVVSGSGMAGLESSNSIVTKKIRNHFYLCGDGESYAGVRGGLLAPRVAICAGHQANMVLRLILGMEEV